MDKKIFIEKAKDLYKGYKPNEEVMSQLAKIELIAVVGITGVGKSTIIDDSGLPLVLSDMTRDPREGEKNGIDVWFRSDYDTLLKEIEEGYFVQFLVGHTGQFYGTKISSYPSEGQCAMPIITSALSNFQDLGFRSIRTVYILPPNFEEWMNRSSMHNDPDINKRYIEAEESLEYALNNDLYFIINNDINLAVSKFLDFVKGLQNKDHQDEARIVVKELLTKIRLRLQG